MRRDIDVDIVEWAVSTATTKSGRLPELAVSEVPGPKSVDDRGRGARTARRDEGADTSES
jgi:hypothetical protein